MGKTHNKISWQYLVSGGGGWGARGVVGGGLGFGLVILLVVVFC